MSVYRPMPDAHLQAAIGWLEQRRYETKLPDEERIHVEVLANTIRQELLPAYERWYAWERYQDFIRPRNELAQKFFTANVTVNPGTAKDTWDEDIKMCLELADRFLEISGEKVKKAEEIKERLREVLGWKP